MRRAATTASTAPPWARRLIALIGALVLILVLAGCRDEVPRLEPAEQPEPPTETAADPDAGRMSRPYIEHAYRLSDEATEGFTEAQREAAALSVVATLRARFDALDLRADVSRQGEDIVVVRLPPFTDFPIGVIDPGGKLRFVLAAPEATRRGFRDDLAANQMRTGGPFEFDTDRLFTRDPIGALRYPYPLPADTALVLEPAQRDGERIFRVHLRTTDGLELAGDAIETATAALDDHGAPVVRLEFDDAGRERLAELTSAHVGEVLLVLLDEEVSMAPVIRDPITEGEVEIRLGHEGTLEEARALALALRTNALPAPLEHLGTIEVPR